MAGKILQFSRRISTNPALRASMSEPLKVSSAAKHDDKAWKMWRTLFFVACVPVMVLSYINCQIMEEPPRPDFVKYSYLRIRNKKYPWRDGVQTLFHNPHVNALPDGYEEVEGHH